MPATCSPKTLGRPEALVIGTRDPRIDALRLLDAAGDDILVRRQARGGPELAGEVVGAEVGDRSEALQGQARRRRPTA
jgi:hypothetical protein